LHQSSNDNPLSALLHLLVNRRKLTVQREFDSNQLSNQPLQIDRIH
jgi:hypothetical protein